MILYDIDTSMLLSLLTFQKSIIPYYWTGQWPEYKIDLGTGSGQKPLSSLENLSSSCEDHQKTE